MVRIDGYSWLPKITRALLGLIIFFSATQLGLHFWPSTTLVYGVRIDYLSPTIYFFDILIIMYLVLKGSDPQGFLVSLLPVLLVNLLFSQNPLSTLSWSLHLILYLMFIFSTSSYDLRSTISKTLPLAMLFEVSLGLIQVMFSYSVGGLLHWVGERTVAVGAPAVATASFMGGVVLRAYATFGHPNVLAGWLVICLLILVVLKSKKPLLITASTLATIGVLLAQSRAAALALFGLVIPFYFLKTFRVRFLYYLITLLLCLLALPTGALTRGSDLSLVDRLNLQGLSLKVVSQYPAFGTGAEASLSTYPAVAPNFRLLQPDHDSFTLFLSWFGLFGVLALFIGSDLLRRSWPTAKMFSRTSKTNSETRSDPQRIVFALFPILPLLLLDHYLLTSPQGLFILLLYLRCCEK